MQELIRVTKVCSLYSNFDMIDKAVLKRASERGTKVHDACLSYCNGLIPMPDIECAGYYDSFLKWFELWQPEVYEIEPEWIDPFYRFVGHPDLILGIKDPDFMVVVVDLKTPLQGQRSWKMQLAAYWRLAEVNGFKEIKRAGSLRLDPGGKGGTMSWYDKKAQNESDFLSALDLYRRYVA